MMDDVELLLLGSAETSLNLLHLYRCRPRGGGGAHLLEPLSVFRFRHLHRVVG